LKPGVPEEERRTLKRGAGKRPHRQINAARGPEADPAKRARGTTPSSGTRNTSTSLATESTPVWRTGERLAVRGSTAHLIPSLRSRKAPPLGYFAETPRAASGWMRSATKLNSSALVAHLATLT
jgi:hypothetical protein